MTYTIRKIECIEFDHYLPQLCELLVDGVHSGASISFVLPFSVEDATNFWQGSVKPNITSKERLLFIAEEDGELLGCVQLIIQLPPNQPHHCQVAKLIVDQKHRGKGVGRSLMTHIIEHAINLDKTLMTLDTRTGDVSQKLYESLGFELAGIIPNFALDPDKSKISSTSVMFKHL